MPESFDEIYQSMIASRADAIAKSLDPEGHPKGRDLPSEYAPIRKSAKDCPDVGRVIKTVAMAKSAASRKAMPESVASVNGAPSRPTLESVRKSASAPVRPVMITGMDSLRKSAEQDWTEYNSFISNNE